MEKKIQDFQDDANIQAFDSVLESDPIQIKQQNWYFFYELLKLFNKI